MPMLVSEEGKGINEVCMISTCILELVEAIVTMLLINNVHACLPLLIFFQFFAQF